MTVSLPTARRRLFDLGLVLLLTIGPAILSSVTAHLWTNDYSYPLAHIKSAHKIFVYLGAIALMLYAVRSQGRTAVDIGISFRWSDLLVAVGLFGAWWGVAQAYPWVRLYFWEGGVMDMRMQIAPYVASQFTALLVLYTLAGAAYEELIVRGYLMTEVMDLAHSRLLAIVLSLALQVSYHSYQGAFALGFHVVGFLPAAIYFAYYRRAVPVALGHALCNLWIVWGGGMI